MAVDLNFTKNDPGQCWGFRLVGGKEFDQPIFVVKVDENSLAEQFGLEVGDVLVRINDIPLTGLTHVEVHDILTQAGTEFKLGVRKGGIPFNVANEDNYEFEFSKLVQEIEETVKEEATEIENDAVLAENLAGKEEIVYVNENKKVERIFSENLTHGIKKDKKWSTFLVKPEKPMPEQKKIRENPKIEGEPYKVVIKKQPPKRFFTKEKKVQFDQNVIQVEVETDEFSNNDYNEDYEESDETEVKYYEETIKELHEPAEQEINEERTEEEQNYENDVKENDIIEEVITYKPLSEIRIETPELTTTLEEQLREVQKQLQLLSQLPSSIQTTLDAVSKQLAHLVGIKDEEEGEGKQDEEDENVTISEKAEAIEDNVNNEEGEDDDSVIGDELEEDIITEEIKQIMERCEEEEESEEEKKEEESGPTLEEIEEKIRQEEAAVKKEKENVMERQNKKPIVRPIILPGGRKWTDPEDAVPIFRKTKKLSEEKIFETIENSLEIIAGKRKGINFLKYQPPPKNLDYLQKSEVYRLIHNTEPPIHKGIPSRPEFIPSVQDYYEASKDMV